jgi:hypothetical protein
MVSEMQAIRHATFARESANTLTAERDGG